MSAEFAVMGETQQGKTVTIRRGFPSEEAAEDYPVRLASWRRVWVEEVQERTEPKRGRPPRRNWGAWSNAAFSEVEQAAVEGRRCPLNSEGHINSKTLGDLAHAGKIRIEVFAHNWRVVTILCGPNAGKQTAPPPYAGIGPAYVVIGKEGREVRA